MAIIGGDQGKAGESKGSGRKADDLRLSCLCLLLLSPVKDKIMCIVQYSWSGRHYTNGNRSIWIYIDLFSLPRNWESAPGPTQCLVEGVVLLK